MLSGPIKLAVGAALIAAVAGSVLSANVAAPPAQSAVAANRAPAPAAGQKSWFSGLFDGIEFNRAPAQPAKPVAQQVAAQTSGYGRMELHADAGGHYQADVEIEGLRIPMLVDTGATLISLTSDDASKLGIRPAPSDYNVEIRTANGVARAARVVLGEVRLGTLFVRSVDTIVLPRDVQGKSLLGMSFLKKLSGFEVASGNLVLRQ